ncbi:MAG: hypothetical protein P8129_21875, partial [Anaerolineae bacterium]
PAAGRQAGVESLALTSTSLAAILAHWGLAIAHSAFEEDSAAWEQVRKGLQHADFVALPPLKAWLLPVAAFLLGRQGQGERAVELLSLARRQSPDGEGWTALWRPLVELRGRLQAELGAEGYEAAWRRGQALDIESATASLLEGGH